MSLCECRALPLSIFVSVSVSASTSLRVCLFLYSHMFAFLLHQRFLRETLCSCCSFFRFRKMTRSLGWAPPLRKCTSSSGNCFARTSFATAKDQRPHLFAALHSTCSLLSCLVCLCPSMSVLFSVAILSLGCFIFCRTLSPLSLSCSTTHSLPLPLSQPAHLHVPQKHEAHDRLTWSS